MQEYMHTKSRYMELTLLTFACGWLVISKANAQSIDSAAKPAFKSYTSQDYTLKSKRQKTIAWMLLGAGDAVAITGYIVGINSIDHLHDFDKTAATSGGMMLAGGVANAVQYSTICCVIQESQEGKSVVKYRSLSRTQSKEL